MKETLTKVALILVLPLIILLTTVNMIATNPNTYMDGYDKYDRAEFTGIERTDLEKITQNFIDYMYGDKEDLQIRLKVFDKERDIFNEKELLHMVDVKNLITLGKIVLIGSAFILILSIYYLYQRGGMRKVMKGMLGASLTSLVVIPIGYLLLPKNFYDLFNVFHEVLFTNDLWLLNEKTDILLQLHPLNFFMDIGINIGIVFVGANLLILVSGATYLFMTRNES